MKISHLLTLAFCAALTPLKSITFQDLTTLHRDGSITPRFTTDPETERRFIFFKSRHQSAQLYKNLLEKFPGLSTQRLLLISKDFNIFEINPNLGTLFYSLMRSSETIRQSIMSDGEPIISAESAAIVTLNVHGSTIARMLKFISFLCETASTPDTSTIENFYRWCFPQIETATTAHQEESEHLKYIATEHTALGGDNIGCEAFIEADDMKWSIAAALEIFNQLSPHLADAKREAEEIARREAIRKAIKAAEIAEAEATAIRAAARTLRDVFAGAREAIEEAEGAATDDDEEPTDDDEEID